VVLSEKRQRLQQSDELCTGSLSLLTKCEPFIARPPKINAMASTNPVAIATAMFHFIVTHPTPAMKRRDLLGARNGGLS